MSVLLGKIVSSESHLLYHVRIFDASECAIPPKPKDFSLGTFVAISNADAAELIVGIVANTRLINPEGGHFGPRLTIPHEQNAVFAPDYLSDVGVLISVLLLGRISNEAGVQGIPPTVLPVGSEAKVLPNEEIVSFHKDQRGRFQMRYYPLLMEMGPGFSMTLIQSVCDTLDGLLEHDEKRILSVVRKNVVWQNSVGTIR